MQLEYKDGGPVWLAGNQTSRREALAEWERRQRSREEMERKSLLDRVDRRIEELRRELRALGEDV